MTTFGTPRPLPVLLAVGAVALASCVGNLTGNGLTSAGSTTDGTSAGGSSTATPTVSDATATNLPIRHLLNRELVNTYSDLLGHDVVTALSTNTLMPDTSASGYDNDVSVQSMSATRLSGYMGAAKAVSEFALADARIQAVMGCRSATVDASCVDTFLPKFGRRVFRRPMTDDELTQYKTLYASESNGNDGARLMVRALLSAPAFLYQPEVGSTAGANKGYVRLTPNETATKLSLLLLGTTPSDDLLDAADAGNLASKDDVAQAAEAMLQQPAGKAYLRNFAINWLGLSDAAGGGLTSTANDSAALHADMAEETLRLYDDFAAPGAHFADFYVAPYSYVSANIAPIYGVSSPSAGSWAKVDLSGKPRLGFLTQPAMLNITGLANFPSIERGKYVMERLLCRNAGTPPAAAQSVVQSSDSTGKTEREQLAVHLASPSCAACHDSMDPIGFGFERYDAVGNYITADSKGRSLTGQGAVTGTGAFSFTGPTELATHLAQSDEAQTCVAQKLAQYLLGRALNDGDDGVVAQLLADLKTKDVPTTIIDFVSSDAFLTRKIN